MSNSKKVRIERCAHCGGKVTIRCGHMGILFFDYPDCGACVSFKNIRYPFRVQADNPIACFNRRYGRRQKWEA